MQPHCNQRATCEILEKTFCACWVIPLQSFSAHISLSNKHIHTKTPDSLWSLSSALFACFFFFLIPCYCITLDILARTQCVFSLPFQYSTLWCYSICKFRLQNIVALEAKHASNMQNNINLLEFFPMRVSTERDRSIVFCKLPDKYLFFLTSIAAL